jgi:hypothetical protein
MRRVLAAERTELAQLDPFRRLLLVLGRAVVATLALAARHLNDVSHRFARSSKFKVQSSKFKVQVQSSEFPARKLYEL